MRLTWYGHSAFRVEFADTALLIDPFLCAAAPLDKLVADRLELIDPGVKDEMFPTREPGGPGGEPDV